MGELRFRGGPGSGEGFRRREGDEAAEAAARLKALPVQRVVRYDEEKDFLLLECGHSVSLQVMALSEVTMADTEIHVRCRLCFQERMRKTEIMVNALWKRGGSR